MGPKVKIVILVVLVSVTVTLILLIESRFSLSKYTALIEEHCRGREIDPALVEAVIFAESGHRSSVVSHKGAVGLMQLMPETAQEMGDKLGIREIDESRLKDPDLNLRLGIEYLSQLLERYGSTELALAAYNAGPGRVAKWRSLRPDLEPADLVEQLAFDETRRFVARVLKRYRAASR